jgi:predicted membrane protein
MITIIIVAIVLLVLFFFGPLSIITYLLWNLVKLCLKVVKLCLRAAFSLIGRKRKTKTVLLEPVSQQANKTEKEA